MAATTASAKRKQHAAPAARKPPANLIQRVLEGSLSPASNTSILDAIRSGLPGSSLRDLKTALDVSNEQLAPLVGLSRATLTRRTPSRRLTPEEGDRVVRYARIYAMAVQVMGTPDHARAWLKAPRTALAGATPLDYALTELGAREVEDLLQRIEHGVYC